MTVDPLGRFVYVVNGDNFDVSGFAINASTGALTALDGSPFWLGEYPGPVGVEPSGRFAYIINNHFSAGTRDINVYAIDAVTGALTNVPGSLFAVGDNLLPITFEPSGKFAYGANYLDGTISVFAIDAVTGVLTEVVGSPFYVGGEPDSLSVDPRGKFLYLGDPSSRTISVFSIDAVTGGLTSAGSPFAARVGAPAIVRIVQ
jgi:6-phosphogluconolactonase (cycloisomerase 2 family)